MSSTNQKTSWSSSQTKNLHNFTANHAHNHNIINASSSSNPEQAVLMQAQQQHRSSISIPSTMTSSSVKVTTQQNDGTSRNMTESQTHLSSINNDDDDTSRSTSKSANGKYKRNECKNGSRSTSSCSSNNNSPASNSNDHKGNKSKKPDTSPGLVVSLSTSSSSSLSSQASNHAGKTTTGSIHGVRIDENNFDNSVASKQTDTFPVEKTDNGNPSLRVYNNVGTQPSSSTSSLLQPIKSKAELDFRMNDDNKLLSIQKVISTHPKLERGPPLSSSKSSSAAAANNIASKNEKSKSKPTASTTRSSVGNTAASGGGRPRSNSVPFNFLSTKPNTSPKGQLRRGKWTVEEEEYVARVIQDFNSGFLNAPPGTTLRTYLSDKLNCDPMRITKKFTGDSCIGKRVFHPAVRCSTNATLIDKAQSELDALERRWEKRLEMQQKDMAKKQAASAAAAAAASLSGRMQIHGKSHLNQKSLNKTESRAVVAQTASWLDRANTLLSQAHGSSNDSSDQEAIKIRKSNSDEVEKQMKEVERLIDEGPIIQKTSAGLQTLLESTTSPTDSAPPRNEVGRSCTSIDVLSKRKVSDDTPNNKGIHQSMRQQNVEISQAHYSGATSLSISHSFNPEKRMRKSFSHNNIQDHEAAVTLVGFLSSVRQAAAASGVTPSK
mmetsp:Transcript_9930/g.12584  ORF Transcript_9930/g.12584 Transcript_9930/m.12584 type:complete len:663 (+) Transcript_9930:298-2286(+)